jgi:hypothetical protein
LLVYWKGGRHIYKLNSIICIVSYRGSIDDDDDNDFPSSFEEELAYMVLLQPEGSQGTDFQEMNGQVNITGRR